MSAASLLPLAVCLILSVVAGVLFLRLQRNQVLLAREAQRAAALSRALALLTDAMQAPARDLPAAVPPARRLFDLADQASDLLAAQAGPRVLREEALALGPFVEGVIATLEAPGRRWRIDPSLAGITLRADQRALRAALRAVLQRSLRETAADDRIALRFVPAPDVFALVIEDEGAGHAAADLDPGGTATGTRGLDLGLAMARDLLRAHGGELELEAADGIGARAWLTLPSWRLVEAPAMQVAA